MEKQEYYIDLNNKVEKMLRKGEFLGSGHNGIVYLLPDKKVIKIFKEKRYVKKKEKFYKKLITVNIFPKYMIMGTTLY